MDIRCTFLANCIARGNRKLFLQTLYYGFSLCVFVVLTARKVLGTYDERDHSRAQRWFYLRSSKASVASLTSATTLSETAPEAQYIFYLIICFGVVFLQTTIYSVATFCLSAFKSIWLSGTRLQLSSERLHGKCRELLFKADARFIRRTLYQPSAESFVGTNTTEENENQPQLHPNDALLKPMDLRRGRNSVALWFPLIFPEELCTETSYEDFPM
mmetsp:Transcript_19707/g.78324  ORF Transcript_19707/g.78324 Transcript_19707/m.78324 type:complete len:215 (-) Transcript_19707:515-1159(-)